MLNQNSGPRASNRASRRASRTDRDTSTTVVPPRATSSGAPHSQRPRVIFAHGLGQVPRDLRSFCERLQTHEGLAHVEFVLPGASYQEVVMCGGERLPSWFELGCSIDAWNAMTVDEQLRLDARDIDAGIARFLRTNDGHCDNSVAFENCGVQGDAANHDEKSSCQKSPVIYAGFSQGGSLALYAGLKAVLQADAEPAPAAASAQTSVDARRSPQAARAGPGSPKARKLADGSVMISEQPDENTSGAIDTKTVRRVPVPAGILALSTYVPAVDRLMAARSAQLAPTDRSSAPSWLSPPASTRSSAISSAKLNKLNEDGSFSPAGLFDSPVHSPVRAPKRPSSTMSHLGRLLGGMDMDTDTDVDVKTFQKSAVQKMPLFLAHGTSDRVLALPLARKTRGFVERNFANTVSLEYREYQGMGHDPFGGKNSLEGDVAEWLRNVLGTGGSLTSRMNAEGFSSKSDGPG